jgi:glycosyltransferase involved in cell wall biosynthesis
MNDKILSVIVPVFNEKDTVLRVLQKLIQYNFVKEVIVIDDGSSDASPELIKEFSLNHSQIICIFNEKNSGKTSAIAKGIEVATGEIIIIQDADLEYDPEEIFSVIEPIILGKADVVYGSRFLVKKASRVLYFYHYLANKLLTFLSNMLTNLNMTDIETCYKAFTKDIIKSMLINSTKFGFEIEVTAKIAKLNCRIYEVPISYYGRTYQEGKKIDFIDGIFALYYIFYYNLFVTKKESFTQKFL